MHYFFPEGFIRAVPRHPQSQPLKEVPVLLRALLFAMVLKPTTRGVSREGKGETAMVQPSPTQILISLHAFPPKIP